MTVVKTRDFGVPTVDGASALFKRVVATDAMWLHLAHNFFLFQNINKLDDCAFLKSLAAINFGNIMNDFHTQPKINANIFQLLDNRDEFSP
ncbi:MAG: hypothetical protein IGS49_21270 [Chlorogloeopsis fritschii C42_A2020_084]|uniref:hypothetical protein n=1 Tax=Chlorogloeopsis fritschii TaxID=1124 RepID=UPI0019D8F162|nr:hypothetical protein [Chlorogloeopsis fritschii]MBF2007903.1 hypothetical protein [Chlorogloeopsis fritschii C42_A2020_084]